MKSKRMTALSKVVTFETAAGAAFAIVLTATIVTWYQRRKKFREATEWKRVGVVNRLCMYPLKSGHENELDSAICTEYGIQALYDENLYQLRDRNFLVYNESDKKFETAAVKPVLVLIKMVAVDKNRVSLDAPNMPTLILTVPDGAKNSKDKITQYLGEQISTIDCGDEPASWISKYLLNKSSGYRLGYNDASCRRKINISHEAYKKVYPKLNDAATGLYSNLSSYLLVNKSSVDDLNTRIQNSDITYRNFRSNIIVDSPIPYAEDNWTLIKIGNSIFYKIKACNRCSLVTVNHETGTRSSNNEPLKTLRKYRLMKDVENVNLDGNSPVMGINLAVQTKGTIKVGDIVYVKK